MVTVAICGVTWVWANGMVMVQRVCHCEVGLGQFGSAAPEGLHPVKVACGEVASAGVFCPFLLEYRDTHLSRPWNPRNTGILATPLGQTR